MSDLWHFCAAGDGTVTSDQTYYADRDHPELADCMDIRGTRNPPEDAERIGQDGVDDGPPEKVQALLNEHWNRATSLIEDGMYDDYLAAITEYDDRDSIIDAVQERRENL